MQTVRVKMFAGLQGLVGAPVVELTLPAGATVGQLRERMVEEYPVLEAFMGTLVVAIGEEMVPVEHVIAEGEPIELIPPIAGG